MFDDISEKIEMFLVALGISLNQITPEEKKMVTLLLVFLLVAFAGSRALQLTLLR
jgi:hypothetical protein